MSARKAYISSLGTTGLLIAAALSMLIVVGALVAFDRWPTQAIAEAESVPVTGGATVSHRARPPVTIGRARLTAISEARSRAVLRRAAARAGRVGHATVPAPAPAVSEPIVSDLPAPNTAPSTPAPAAPAQQQQAPAPAPAPEPQTPEPPAVPVIPIPPGSLAPAAEDTLTGATTGLGDVVGGLSPALGQTVRGTGSTATGTIHTLLGGK
jgi:hypothetical protein